LVAKSLLMHLARMGFEGLIDKLILVAVPQIGTPQAVGALLHGFNQGIPFIVAAKTMAELGLNMPSAYSLLPSAAYFNSIFDPVASIRTSRTNIDSYDSFRDFLLAKTNQILLDKAQRLHEDIDAWIPSRETEVIQIGGWGIDTVSGIEYYQGKKSGKLVTQYKPIIVSDGDSTIVIPSALYLSTSTPQCAEILDGSGIVQSRRDNKEEARRYF
jgi:hypothetical protein